MQSQEFPLPPPPPPPPTAPAPVVHTPPSPVEGTVVPCPCCKSEATPGQHPYKGGSVRCFICDGSGKVEKGHPGLVSGS